MSRSLEVPIFPTDKQRRLIRSVSPAKPRKRPLPGVILGFALTAPHDDHARIVLPLQAFEKNGEK